jgi:hypothetical protein
MGRAALRGAVNVAVLAVVVAGGAAGCSKSTHAPTVAKALQSAAAQAAAGASNAAAGASTAAAAAGGASSAAAAGNTLLAGNAGCKLLSAADVKAAAGIDLGNITGNISGGMQGASAHDACLYTKDEGGTGPAVNLDINTFSDAASQLSTQRAKDTDTAKTLNDMAPNAETIKDVTVGDGGAYEAITSAGPDELVWFVKGSKLVDVEVSQGVPGAALTLAKLLAGKV